MVLKAVPENKGGYLYVYGIENNYFTAGGHIGAAGDLRVCDLRRRAGGQGSAEVQPLRGSPKGEGGDPPLAGGGLEGAPGPVQDDSGVRGGVLGRQPSGGEQVGDRNGGPQHLQSAGAGEAVRRIRRGAAAAGGPDGRGRKLNQTAAARKGRRSFASAGLPGWLY